MAVSRAQYACHVTCGLRQGLLEPETVETLKAFRIEVSLATAGCCRVYTCQYSLYRATGQRPEAGI